MFFENVIVCENALFLLKPIVKIKKIAFINRLIKFMLTSALMAELNNSDISVVYPDSQLSWDGL